MVSVQIDLSDEQDLQKTQQWLQVLEANNITEFRTKLRCFPCNKCSLGSGGRRPVVARGNPQSQVMIVGEAPGYYEERDGIPFSGPAGQLLDKIFESVGLDTNSHAYLSNVCRCRPRAPVGSGRENLTPTASEVLACKPYLNREIELINPRIVIATGKTAAVGMFGFNPKVKMEHITGTFFPATEDIINYNPCLRGRELFVLYHPAAILHAGGEYKQQLRLAMWEHIKKVKERLTELGIVS